MCIRGLPGQAGQSLTQGGRDVGNYSEAFIGIDTAKLRNAAVAMRSGNEKFRL